MFNKPIKYLILSKQGAFFVETEPKFHVQSLSYSESEEDIKNLVYYTKNFVGQSKLGVLISDDLVYVFSSKLKFIDEFGKPIDEKALVEAKIRSQIPEDISEVVWDYKAKQVDAENKLFQIAVTNPLTTKIVSKLFEEEAAVDFVEPLCYTLARSIDSNAGMHIIVSCNIFEKCILISDNRYIHFALTFEKENFNEEFNQVLDYASEKYFKSKSDSVKTKVFASADCIKEMGLQIPAAFADSYEITVHPVNLFDKEILEKREHHGQNEDVLNILPSEVRKKSFFNFFLKEKKKVVLGGIIALIILISGMAIFSFSKSGSETTDSENIDQPAVQENNSGDSDQTAQIDAAATNTQNTQENNPDVDTATTTPSETQQGQDISTAADFSQYKLLVLNGSGIPGEAAKMSDAFIKAGFGEPDLGNYPSGTTKQTVIRIKSSTPAPVLDKATELLEGFDVAFSDDFLDPTSPYDIEVVIGETRLPS